MDSIDESNESLRAPLLSLADIEIEMNDLVDESIIPITKKKNGSDGKVHEKIEEDSLTSLSTLATDTATDNSSNSNSMEAWKYVLLLNFVAILWGTQHSVIKSIVDDGTILPSTFSLLRFGLSAFLAAPFTPSFKNATAWRWGAELGLYMFAGYAMQAIGLQYTTAQKSGFLLYLNVKFVPIINSVFFGRNNNSPYVWISAFVAFMGTGLIALNNNSDQNVMFVWNVGDLWSIAAAISSALFIIRLETASKILDGDKESAQLNSASLWSVSLLCLLWNFTQQGVSIFSSSSLEPLSRHLLPILYLSFVATALANYIQTIGQRNMTAERASIIYAMDPVYGAIFAYILLGERLSVPWGIIGAGMITVAAATNALFEVKQAMDSTSNQEIERSEETN